MFKSLLAIPISSGRLWEISFFLVTLYLLFFPPLSCPQSYAVALGGGLFLLLFRTIPPEALQGLGRVFLLFLFFLPVSAIWSLQPGISLQSAGFVFLGVLLYWMFRSNDPATQGRMEVGGLLLAGLAALLALRQWLFGFDETRELLPRLGREEFLEVQKAVFYHRATGPLVTPGALAALMILFIPLCFTLSVVGTGFKKRLFGLLTVLLGLALLATQSVGAFAALAVACLAILAARKAWGAVATVLVLGLAAMGGVIWSRGLQNWDISSFSGRLGLWGHALQLFWQHPLLGSGFGAFGEAYQQAGFPLDAGASKFAHNLLLQLLVETGLAGTVLFLGTAVSLAWRFKVPSRWEGWGAMTGVLAFLLFSLVDLPFQMPELIWFFALVLGRLEWRPELWFSPSPSRGEGLGEGDVNRRRTPHPTLSRKGRGLFEKHLTQIQNLTAWGLLAVFLVSGFWPPFRAWSFALVAVSIWSLAALFGQKFTKVPLWIGLGSLFLGLRAFFSPSALGAVWFLEMAGILLAFYLVLPCFEKPQRFLNIFFLLGLAWALKVWWASFHYAEPGLRSWIHFQYSDVKDWVMFPNPKQVGIFLVPLVLWLGWKPWSPSKLLVGAAGFLTMVRLKASSSFAGLGAGLFYRVWTRSRAWAVVALLVMGAALFAYRFHDSSSTSKDRLHIWMDSSRVWLESPWIGVGPGAFAGLYHQVKTPRETGVSRYLMDARYSHNEYLELLTAFGLVGFGFAVAFLVTAWRNLRDEDHRAALAGLGTASFVDFCLHTPLIALQGVGLLAAGNRRKPEITLAGGFLALGLGIGLFGPPAFSGILIGRAQADLSENQFLPSDLRGLEAAEQMNAWDARCVEAEADYLEKLFYATKDPNWARRADEAFDRSVELEPADGQKKLDNAERLMLRLSPRSPSGDFQKTMDAFRQAEQAMPFNAFVRDDEGVLYAWMDQTDKAIAVLQKAVELEPNFAQAWFRLGVFLGKEHHPAESRQAFRTSLAIYNRWKDEGRIADVERRLVGLPPNEAQVLQKEKNLK